MGWAPSSSVLAQATHGVIEGLVDRDVDVLALAPCIGAAVHDQLGPRHRQVDPHAVVLSVMLASVGGLDRHLASDDAPASG